MKKNTAIIFLTVFIFTIYAHSAQKRETGFFMHLFGTEKREQNKSLIPDSARISSEELHMGIKKEIWFVYDTRKYLSYIYAHVPTARSIPLFSLELRMSEIPREKEIVLIFENITNAEKGWKILINNGYNPQNLKVFNENMDNWIKKGYPFEDSIPGGGC